MTEFDSRIPTFLQLGFNENKIKALKSYVDLLWQSNEDLNLISRKMTAQDLIDNHLIDCLLPLQKFPTHIKHAADFGSGGGLPGVIYAIQFPQIQFHLFEKSPKKQEFLTKCKAITKNIEIHGDIPSDLKNIELIMARGFKPLDVILDVSRKHYLAKGKYFLFKGRKEKIEEELILAKKKFKDLEVNIESLKSPILEVERHLVLI